MKSLKIFESFLNRLRSNKTVYKIRPGSDIYKFVSTENPNYYFRDPSGGFIISDNGYEVETFDRTSSILKSERKINQGSDIYQYIKCEYRQNSPTLDLNGNYLLNDEMILKKKR